MAPGLLSALRFASDKHRKQRRKDSEASPYINHPIAVAELLASIGNVDDLVALQAAILHDTIEDTQTSADELRSLFGADVASVVLEVTDDKSLPKEERKRLQIEHARFLSPRAKLVKLADKIANVSDILASPPAGWSVDRRLEYFSWAERVVAGLRGVNRELEEEFDRAVARGREEFAPA